MSVTARSRMPAGQSSGAPLPLVLAGAAAGAGAAILSYLVLALVALAAWMLEPAGAQDWAQMLEAASAAWLAGMGLAPVVSGVTLSLLPVGFVVLPVVALAGAGRWAVSASAVARRGEAFTVAAAAALAFAAVTALVAGMSASIQVSPARAAITGAILAAAVTALSALRRAGLLPLDTVPEAVRHVLGAATVALLVLVALSGLALAGAIALHVDDITALLMALDGGMAGALLLAVLSLGYLPTALTWTLAYLLGPGVAVGSGAVVGPFAETASTSLPGFPLLAALPGEAPLGAVLLPLAGVAAGVVAGLLLRSRGLAGRQGASVAAMAAGVVGIALAALCWLASGSLGDAALVGLGPAPLAVAAAGFVTVGIGAVTAAALPRRSAADV